HVLGQTLRDEPQERDAADLDSADAELELGQAEELQVELGARSAFVNRRRARHVAPRGRPARSLSPGCPVAPRLARARAAGAVAPDAPAAPPRALAAAARAPPVRAPCGLPGAFPARAPVAPVAAGLAPVRAALALVPAARRGRSHVASRAPGPGARAPAACGLALVRAVPAHAPAARRDRADPASHERGRAPVAAPRLDRAAPARRAPALAARARGHRAPTVRGWAGRRARGSAARFDCVLASLAARSPGADRAAVVARPRRARARFRCASDRPAAPRGSRARSARRAARVRSATAPAAARRRARPAAR